MIKHLCTHYPPRSGVLDPYSNREPKSDYFSTLLGVAERLLGQTG